MSFRIAIVLLIALAACSTTGALPIAVTGADFPVSNERMADLVERAVAGDLILPNTTDDQVIFLKRIQNARVSGEYDGSASDTCHAFIAARAGDLVTANDLLERVMRSRDCDRPAFCKTLYSRWNATTLSYRFLHWWVTNVTRRIFWGITLLVTVVNLLLIPLVIKFRQAVLQGNRSHSIVLAAALTFAELTPLVWGSINAGSWVFLYDEHGDAATPGPTLVAVVAFFICSRKVFAWPVRTAIAVLILAVGWLPAMGIAADIGMVFAIPESTAWVGASMMNQGIIILIIYLSLAIVEAKQSRKR